MRPLPVVVPHQPQIIATGILLWLYYQAARESVKALRAFGFDGVFVAILLFQTLFMVALVVLIWTIK